MPTLGELALFKHTGITEYESWPDDGQYVVLPDLDGDMIPFEIIEAEVDIANHTKTVECVHLSDELKTSAIRTYLELSASATTALTLVLAGTRWEVGTVDTFTARNFAIDYATPMEALDWIADNYTGRLKFRVAIDAAGFTNFYVDLLTPVNTLRGVRAEFGRNLENINIMVDRRGLLTKVIGLGQAESVDVDTDEATPLTFTSLTGNNYVADEDARLLYGRYVAGTRQHIEGIYESQAQTQAGLLQETISYLATVNHPRVTIEARIIDLEQVTVTDITGAAVTLSHEMIRLHDSLYVIARDKGILAEVQATVYRIVRPLKTPELTQLELGEYKLLLTNTLRSVETTASELQLRRAVHNRATLFEPTETEYYKLDKVLLGTDAIFSGSLTAATGTFTGTLDAASIISGVIKSAVGSTTIDLDNNSIVHEGVIDGKLVRVEFSQANPFKLSIMGPNSMQDYIYITDDTGFSGPNILVTSKYDINEDGIVDYRDLDLLLDYILQTPGTYPSVHRMDVNNSGHVSSADLNEVLLNSVSQEFIVRGNYRFGLDATGVYASTDRGVTKTYVHTW